MHEPEIASPAEICKMLAVLDSHIDKEKSMIESDSSELYAKSGLNYQTDKGPLTALFETETDVCYFQGGFVFIVERTDFYKFVESLRHGTVSKRDRSNDKLRQLSVVEVEFILGILSVIDPLAYWTVFGSNLIEFCGRNKGRLNIWMMQLSALLLTQRILKKYAGKLYRKLSRVLAWSSLSENVSTDDGSVARFAGFLLGYYGCEKIVEREILKRWHILSHVLEKVQILLEEHDPCYKISKAKFQGQMIDLARSIKKSGINFEMYEVRLILEDFEPHPMEFKCAEEILRASFEERILLLSSGLAL